jgi:Tfp pilus assembly protein PilE
MRRSADLIARRWEAGFTINEILGVVVIIGVITMLAYPAMKTFSGRANATSAATRITHTFNRARAQAIRRNRAIVADFILFRANEPGGRIDFLEARTNSCAQLSKQLQDGDNNATMILDSLPVGGTIIENYQGTNEKNVGLRGWRTGSEGPVATARVKLCISPNGKTYLMQRNIREIDSWVEVEVQRYRATQGGAAQSIGPARRLVFPGFGPARLVVN